MSNKKRSMSGYWIVVGSMTFAGTVTAWFQGADLISSPYFRATLVLLAGAGLLLGRGVLTWIWRQAADLAPHRNRERHARNAAARVGAAMETDSAAGRKWQSDIAHALRERHGWRWRYRLPWVLVTGDRNVIANQLPMLVESGWLVADEVVLLWRRDLETGMPDEGWLRVLYRLRRRRPVDAIALAVDDRSDSFASVRRAEALSHGLSRIARHLRWSAPVHVVADTGFSALKGDIDELVGCLLPRRYDDAATQGAFKLLGDRLAVVGTRRVTKDRRSRYMAALSLRIEQSAAVIDRFVATLARSLYTPVETRGVWFLPAAEDHAVVRDNLTWIPVLWQRIGTLGRRAGGRRVGWHPSTLGASIVLAVACVWITGMLISGASAMRELLFANQLTQQLASAPPGRPGLRALREVQRSIERFEYRASNGTPWYTRFGLNRDRVILTGLWRAYASGSRRLIVAPVQQGLESSLATVAAMRTDVSDEATNRQAQAGHSALRAYLMLAEPQRADPKLLAPELERNWLAPASLTMGERQDFAHQFFPFFAQHLQAHPEWAIQPRPDLVNETRQVLLALIGTSNSTETIYRAILNTAAGKYGDQSLVTLLAGTDARGLFSASATVPGVFTRQAWDGYISQAIDEAAQRKNVKGDWVLSASSSSLPAHSGEDLRKALRDLYFKEYARRWQAFANSIEWVRATTLTAIAEQLRLLADSRQSPMIALMKAVEYQGRAGEGVVSLSDTLVAKAQHLIGNRANPAAIEGGARAAASVAPLDASFGPLLRLVNPGQLQTNADTALSLQRYLDAVSTLRLKIEGMTNSGSLDDQARQIAQAQFQGKSSELSETRNYAGLIAASLGEQWSGLGAALFLRPVDQAMQAVMRPAQASLNDAWRQSIADPWTRAFQGRYPFASSDDDASFPELVRFLRDETGLVPAFVNRQLAGALELQGDRWVPTSAGASLHFDPAFLQAINVLQGIASHLLASGAAQYGFDLMPQPSADVTQTQLTVDGQTLKYFNQADRWQPFVWPGNDLLVTGARLEWQTVQAGLNKRFEREGRWAFIRMLASAYVEPLSDARFQLTWKATPVPELSSTAAFMTASSPAAESSTMANDPSTLTPKSPVSPAPKRVTYPITYVMRTDAGKGPLELLALRGFAMPTRIFAPAPDASSSKADIPPPLPVSAIAAARHAEVPLPQEAAPDLE